MSPYESDSPFLDPEQGSEEGGNVGRALIIWIPTVMLAVLAFVVDMPWIGILLAGGAFLLHSVMRTQVAIYALMMAQPIQRLMEVVSGVTTIAKVAAIPALLFTLPRLFRSLSPARWDPCVKWMLGLIIWAMLSIAWSPRFEPAVVGVQTLVLVWGMAILIVLQLDTWEKLAVGMGLYVAACTITNAVLLLTGDIEKISRGRARLDQETLMGSGTINTNYISFIMGLAVIRSISLVGSYRRTL
ncbi:MAG: hypothetical protein O7D94_02835, partial [Planctomycetota bacterium]|nr:hypothetical protein [Planctomycetota bacterium]